MFEHVFVVFGVDWGVSGLRCWLLIHIGQLDLHWYMLTIVALIVCVVCSVSCGHLPIGIRLDSYFVQWSALRSSLLHDMIE